LWAMSHTSSRAQVRPASSAGIVHARSTTTSVVPAGRALSTSPEGLPATVNWWISTSRGGEELPLLKCVEDRLLRPPARRRDCRLDRQSRTVDHWFRTVRRYHGSGPSTQAWESEIPLCVCLPGDRQGAIFIRDVDIRPWGQAREVDLRGACLGDSQRCNQKSAQQSEKPRGRAVRVVIDRCPDSASRLSLAGTTAGALSRSTLEPP